MSISASNYDYIIGLALRMTIKGDGGVGDYAQYLQTTLNGDDVGSLETTSTGLTYHVGSDVSGGSLGKLQFDSEGAGGVSAEINGSFFQVGKSPSLQSKVTDTSSYGAQLYNGPCTAKMYYNSDGSYGLTYNNASFQGYYTYKDGTYTHYGQLGPIYQRDQYSETSISSSHTINSHGISWEYDQSTGDSSLSINPNGNNYLSMIYDADNDYTFLLSYARGQMKLYDILDSTYTKGTFEIYTPAFSFNLSNTLLEFKNNRTTQYFSVKFDEDDNGNTCTLNIMGISLTAKVDPDDSGQYNLFWRGKKILTED